MTPLPASERVTLKKLLFPDAARPVLKTGVKVSDIFLKFGVFDRQKRSFRPFPADADP